MRNDTALNEAGQHYAAAYAAPFKTKDLHEALDQYMSVMPAHPDTKEAEYSRTQVQNTAKSVVPKQELLVTQKELILAHLEHEAPRAATAFAGLRSTGGLRLPTPRQATISPRSTVSSGVDL